MLHESVASFARPHVPVDLTASTALQRIEPKLDAAYAAWWAVQDECEAAGAEMEANLEAGALRYRGLKGEEFLKAYTKSAGAAGRKYERLADIGAAAHKVGEDALKIQAVNLRDLAVLAKVVAGWHEIDWSKPTEDEDYDQLTIRRLVENILQVAGVPLPVITAPIAAAAE